MAYGGQGIARVNGLVIFVRGGVPGDKLRVRVYRKKKNHIEAGIEEILIPSPDRINPMCPYSPYCGGCQWQHIRYEKQLTYKKAHVVDSIQRIAGLKNVLIRDVVPSESVFEHRNKMEFSFSARRWFLPEEMDLRKNLGEFALGLHIPGTYFKVIDIEACMLQNRRGNQILSEVKKYVKGSNMPLYDLRGQNGFWRFLTLRYSKAFNEWMVNIVTSEDRKDIVQLLSDILSDKMGDIGTIVNNINSRRASIAIGEHEKFLFGKGYIYDKIGPFTFQISSNSFFQTNTPTAEKLYNQVADYAELKGNETIFDLYSGTGTISIFLADKAHVITGMEIGKSAVEDACNNCSINSIHNCDFVCGDIRDSLSTISESPDVVITNPPRAGMHRDIIQQILTLSPRKIIYISCNPPTLARDIKMLSDNYELIEIQPFDMFPHAYHIESVAKLCLRN
ncbi:MAG: 23S rRNA (uracil(1939)-C(5))-methyltransferase RlmD [Thermodesulfobacteriota bacterium]|nr:23S rRNA (uracil(1939)-C(5))-methyltransferase RlmD [Thermodesulfobacteriota bacterium]